ncbi:hypothetical protein AB0L59_35765 [Streptomyces sp. NPDC052109]|jgi:hypothetical protein|uniref:hypothetical protein n=1 Tax=Streptomyces sp. NPDC052109 TaxID=3155527 RepID=UPI003430E276
MPALKKLWMMFAMLNAMRPSGAGSGAVSPDGGAAGTDDDGFDTEVPYLRLVLLLVSSWPTGCVWFAGDEIEAGT